MARILIVDDEKSMGQLLEIAFRKKAHMVETALTGNQAKRKLESQIFDLVISDIRMPDLSGLDLLEHVRRVSPETYFILITAYATVDSAVQAVNSGAYRYIIKDDKLLEELHIAVGRALTESALRSENRLLRRELSRVRVDEMVGNDPKMVEILNLIQTVGPGDSTILIVGESGTGKELVARAVHRESPRRDRAFVTINCGAFPDTLLESELFGYVRGAFTGANTNKKGLFLAAHGGTLFLDEISETSPAMQVNLLRVLQERLIRPLGATTDEPIDVRIIAATNRDLKSLVSEGKFREDLFYRISVIPIRLPPLRERKGDIEVLAKNFVERHLKRVGKPGLRLTAQVLQLLRGHDWPGNVRELEHTLEQAMALTPQGEDSIPVEKIQDALISRLAQEVQLDPEGIDFEAQIAEFEKQYLQTALVRAAGVRTRAAQLLKMSYRSFRHYAKKHSL